MADVRPFRAVRPARTLADQVAALPYDVYTREEAAREVEGKPLSFLNIDRPETMFPPEHDMYADDVYLAAKERYDEEKRRGIFIADENPCYYIYELTMDGRIQTGVAALSSVDDYLNGICKKHENTTEEKERDRIRHIDTMCAQTGPIFLSYHAVEEIDGFIEQWKYNHDPENDFVSPDGIGHRVWVIDLSEAVNRLEELFSGVPATYIADGHHRTASAVKVALKRRQEAEAAGNDAPDAEYNYFLSVLFADDQLKILDYNRVVKDLNGLTEAAFLEKLGDVFEITNTASGLEYGEGATLEKAESSLRPSEKYEIGMYLSGKGYKLKVKDAFAAGVKSDPVKSLDVSVLQEEVLSRLLGIGDPRTDSRIRFVGGIKGIKELIRQADAYTKESMESGTLEEKGPGVSFVMYPTSMAELFAVADAGLLMPPKSTWFEPKLRSGLFIHEI